MTGALATVGANPTAPPDPTARRRFLVFRVDGRRYALPAAAVAEVMRVPSVARLPLSPRSLMGLANLRGAAIPVVDPRVLLGLGGFIPRATARAIVLTGSAPLALAVDAVGTLETLDADRIETGQAELVAAPGETLLGAYRGPVAAGAARDAEVTRILDLSAMLATAFAGRRAPTLAPRAGTVTTPAVPEAPAAEYRLLISFEVAGQDFALPVEAIREIVPLPAGITIVPRAEAVLLGVTAWRDSLLPLLSLRGLLGFPPADGRSGVEKVLVASVNGVPIGLVADRARALLRADPTAIDPAPAMLAARSGGEAKITAILRADGGGRLISLLAPELLFREDVMRRIGDQLPRAPIPVGATAASGSGAVAQFVVFRLGQEAFGLPIAAVDEVARVPEQMTRVPKMPKFLEGVINLRGEVLPVVDQRRRFDMPKYDGTGQRLIVVRADRHRAGLIVDSVSEVLRTRSDAIEPPPDLTGEGARLVNGVIHDGASGRMILLLDPAELLTHAEHGALDTIALPETVEAAP